MGAACLGARPGWVRSRGWVLPPAPASRPPPLGGAPKCSPPFSLPRCPPIFGDRLPLSPPCGGTAHLAPRRSSQYSIALSRVGPGDPTRGSPLTRRALNRPSFAAPAWVGVVPLGVFLLFITSGYFCLRQGGVWLVAWSGGRRVGCRLRSGDRLVGWVDDQPPARVWSVHLAGANSAAVWSAGGVRDVRPLVGASFVGWALRRRARPPPAGRPIYLESAHRTRHRAS